MPNCVEIIAGIKGASSWAIVFATSSLASLIAAAVLNLGPFTFWLSPAALGVALALVSIAAFVFYPRMKPDNIKGCIDWNLDLQCRDWWNALVDNYRALFNIFIAAFLAIIAALGAAFWFPGLAAPAIAVAIFAHFPLIFLVPDYRRRVENIKNCVP